jgi:AraC-like DNA-binding protein
MDRFLTYKPSRPLADFVDLLWFYRREKSTHSKERLLPMGTMELVMNLSDKSSPPVLCGPHSEYFSIDTDQPALVLGVHFKPGGAFPFLNLSLKDLHNIRLSLDDLLGRNAGLLHERVLEARHPAAMFRILEESLMALASRPLTRTPVVAFALQEFQSAPFGRTVGDVIDDTGLSPRRFIELFTEQVGLTPKLFCRIQRFQQVLQRVSMVRQVNWAEVALACGYYDQAHFIHDFKTFSGLSPTTYVKVRGEHLNHVPLAS